MATVSLACDSLLLRRSLELFLAGRITTLGQCDLVIGDHAEELDKPLLIIGEHLTKPFDKAQLLKTLERFERLDDLKAASNELVQSSSDKPELEVAIAKLTERFAKELLELIRHKR